MSDISEKAEYLDQKLKSLVDENRFLKNKLKDLETGLDSKEKELSEVTEQFNTIKLARKIGGNGNDQENQELICKASGLAYPIRDDIPVMLESEARQLSADEKLG